MTGIICFLSLIIMLYVMNAYAEAEYSYPNKRKIIKLKVYLHFNLGGNDANAVIIAQPNHTTDSNSIYPFGTLLAINYAVRVGAKPTSKLIGRAKGLAVAANQERNENVLVLFTDLGFTKGKFKGSSFVVISRASFLAPSRELAIIGGTKKFRMAQGFLFTESYSFKVNATGVFAVYKIDATLFHS
ncbi:dirigent protein 4-like [Mercurialis annua]|uniref:dirigent protein 4-like n=1 Tax=Mercurialis annua TaxID=3986 RepID=UPI00215F67F1|nr:dirigent protein 4-like [Mercurialis annua]